MDSVPLLHNLSELYKKIYCLSSHVPKKDRFGIYLKIEHTYLELYKLVLMASLQPKQDKLPTLLQGKIKVELLKQLIRTCSDLHIINQKRYIHLEFPLQEISKMLNGWIVYIKKYSPHC